MDRNQILSTIKSLSLSQGFYGRLLRAIEEDETILDTIESWGCKEPVDLVMALES